MTTIINNENQLNNEELASVLVGNTLMGFLPSRGLFQGGWWVQYYSEDGQLLDDQHGAIGPYAITDDQLIVTITTSASTNNTGSDVVIKQTLYRAPNGIAFYQEGMKGDEDIMHIANVVENGDLRSISDFEKQKLIRKEYNEEKPNDSSVSCRIIDGDNARDFRAVSTLMSKGIYHALHQEWEDSYFYLNLAYELCDEFASGNTAIKITTSWIISGVIVAYGNELASRVSGNDKANEIRVKHFLEGKQWSAAARELVNDSRTQGNLEGANAIVVSILARGSFSDKKTETANEKLKRDRNFLRIVMELTGGSHLAQAEHDGIDPDSLIGVANDMALRDCFRGLRLGGAWKKMILEHSRFHHYELNNIEKAEVIFPPPLIVSEASIRFIINVNNDPISAAIQLYDVEPFYVELDKATLYLGALHLELSQAKDISTIETLKKLWGATFGCRINRSVDHEGNEINCYCNDTIFSILSENGITKLNVVLHGFMYSLPIHAACSETNGQLTYAIELFDIVIYPPWERASKHLRDPELDYAVISDMNPSDSKLFYSQVEVHALENKIAASKWMSVSERGWKKYKSSQSKIKNIWSVFISKWQRSDKLKEDILEVIRKSSHVHISTHSENMITDGGSIVYYGPNSKYSITPKEIAESGVCYGANVFLNCCHTSKTHPGTDIDDYTMPTCFILGGAKNVITTVLPVYDMDAFRISTHIYYLIQSGLSYRDAYRNAMLDCIKGLIPDYLDEVKESGKEDIISAYEYFYAKNDNSVKSWASYTFWTSH